ncbi:MAG: acetyltransferase [Deltaproteobacteria bacterium]|nr:acetyltransferase [Deltaproteobacteria bacterium]
MKKRLVIWGASGHARVVADIAMLSGDFDLAGFIDDRTPERRGEAFCGAQVLGGREVLPGLASAGVSHGLLAFGDCTARVALGAVLRSHGLELAVAVHPSAVVASDVRLGAGTVVAANAVINPNATIGENVIVNTSAVVEHDCVIGEGAHIAPGARLAGRVQVGARAWVGLGALVIEDRRIGADSFIGAGAVVVEHIPDNVVAFGVPATVRRANGRSA